MDSRIFGALFHIEEALKLAYANEAGLAYGQSIARHRGYTDEEIEAGTALYHQRKANPSPILHFTQAELDALLSGPRYPTEAPPELIAVSA